MPWPAVVMAILGAISAAKEGMEAQKEAAGEPGGNKAGGGFNQITPVSTGQMVGGGGGGGGGIPDVSAGLGEALEKSMNAVPSSGGGYGLLDMGGAEAPYSPGLAGRRTNPLAPPPPEGMVKEMVTGQSLDPGPTEPFSIPPEPTSTPFQDATDAGTSTGQTPPADPTAPAPPEPPSEDNTEDPAKTGPSKWEKAAIAANITSSLLNTKGPALPGGGRGFTNIDPVALRFILQGGRR